MAEREAVRLSSQQKPFSVSDFFLLLQFQNFKFKETYTPSEFLLLDSKNWLVLKFHLQVLQNTEIIISVMCVTLLGGPF